MKPQIKFSLALATMFLAFTSIAGINNTTHKVNSATSAVSFGDFGTIEINKDGTQLLCVDRKTYQ